MQAKIKTLVFLVDVKTGKVGLSTKKYGPAKDWYNGYGGKVEYGEDINVGALRELKEEAGISANVDDLSFIAKLVFEFPHLDEDAVGYVFVLTKWQGEPKESNEMTAPKWFDINNLPFNKMWDSDRIWVPLVLNATNMQNDFSQKIFARLVFDKNFKINKWSVEEL